MDSKQEYDYLFKILLVGDSDTGKTNILLRYSDNTFTTAHLATIGIDFKIKTTHVSNKKVKLQIWDTAGQERFRAITTAYYKGAHGIIIVYNVTDRQSFQHVDNWAAQIREFSSEDVTKVLVGNKCDLGERQVSFDEGKALADRLGIEFFETSAKDQLNIEKPFTAVTEKILEKFGVYSNEVPSPKKLEGSSTPVGGEITSLKTGTSFKDLYLDNTFADVIFEVEDEQIYGHKAILAKGCKFFHNLFTSEMKEANSKIIRLEDVKAQSFKVLIAYLYSADNISIDENTALDLVGLADKYLLPDLRKECERVLSGFLNTDNYLKYVSLSEKLGETFLNEAVVKFILKNYETIKDRDDLYDLPKDVMKQVMSGLKAK